MTTSQPQHPEAVISNGQIRAKIYLPDAERGFYRSTRFDWSGIIGKLEYQGHNYYGPWFAKSDPPVHDFIYRDGEIVTGAQSSVTGPAEEFPSPQGYDVAKPGGTFVKIGVGVLRKSDEARYSQYANYPIVDPGTWSIQTHPDAVAFRQRVDDPASGYGYAYQKTVRLMSGRPELVIEHSLENIGRLAIATRQYNHNFLVLDGAMTGPDFSITLPFQIQTAHPPDPTIAEIRGNRVVYTRALAGEDRVTFPIQGYGPAASDYDIRIENSRTGAGVRITSDRPLANAMLWSIRSVISLEPFVDVSTEPGATTNWKQNYNYYATSPQVQQGQRVQQVPGTN